MEIFINDEEIKLDSEIKDLFERAFIRAFADEFGDCKELSSFDLGTLPIELSVSIVSKEKIAILNREYRNIDSATDVLSFPQFMSGDELIQSVLKNIDAKIEDINTLIGDVVICYEKALEQSVEYQTGFKREIVYLFVHSIFHLFGYDHMTDYEKATMREKEERVMEAVTI